MTIGNNKQVYDLTHPQQRIWYVEKLYPGNPINNIGGKMIVKKALDIKILQKAINLVVKNNDGMRMQFLDEDGKIKMYIENYHPFSVRYLDFRKYESPQEELQKYIEAESRKTFDLLGKPLYNLSIFRNSDHETGVIISVHHIILDGWSLNLFFSQLAKTYNHLVYGSSLDELDTSSYLDFIKREQEYLQSKRMYKNKKFWSEKFEILPEEFLYKTSEELAANRVSCEISPEQTRKIRDFLEENQLSTNTFFVSLMVIYLQKILLQEDIIMGMPVLNRSGKKEKNTFGMFTSVMPFRLQLSEDVSFLELMSLVNKEVSSCFFHQKYPYNLLLQDIELLKKGYDNLFQVWVNTYSTEVQEKFDDMPYQLEEYSNGNTLYSLHLIVKEWDPQKILLEFDYKMSDYSAQDIESLFGYLEYMIEQILEKPEINCSQLALMSDKRQEDLLEKFNQTEVDFQHDKLLHEPFEEQVKKNPDCVALIFEDQTLTYRELNERSNQLARVLRAKGIGPDMIVGIRAERSLEMVIGIFGILKAGGAYMPIDPSFPKDRALYMLNNSSSSILLTQSKFASDIVFNGEVIQLEDEALYYGETSNLEKITSAANLAYVIYTSGSTGQPKGVMIEHISVMNRLNWGQKTYPIDERDIIMQKTPFCFDVSVVELFSWSMAGAVLCLLVPGGEKEPEVIVKTIEKKNITSIHFVASMLNAFLDYIESTNGIERIATLRRIFTSGEAVNPQQVNRFNKILYENKQITLHDLYGPTEASIEVSYFDCSTNSEYTRIPIGKPIDNVSLYVVNPKNYKQLQPIGNVGELCIAGVCLARGYLNQTDLTNEKFVENPFLPNTKMYRTGDLARWLPDGNIEYLGRMDEQVKIRGYRIEIGEIESGILRYPEVIDAVVIARKNSYAEIYLCAYVVSHNENIIQEIREYLSQTLPSYMVPSYFIKLDKIPLTANGKFDRKILPEPEGIRRTEHEYIEPSNETQTKIASVFQDVLGIEQVGIEDNFFLLGGDSIKAIQIISRLRQENIQLQVKDILRHQTIANLTSCINMVTQKKEYFQGIVEGEMESLPIHSWFYEQSLVNQNHYNQTIMLKVNSTLDIQILRQAFGELISHHDGLRLNYNCSTKKHIFSNTYINEEFPIQEYDLTRLSKEDQEKEIINIGTHLKGNFDLTGSLLIKAAIVCLSSSEKQLMITAHHIVIDGVSWRILLEDLYTAYQAIKVGEAVLLPKKTASLKEWYENLAIYAQETDFSEETVYWKAIEEKSFVLPCEKTISNWQLFNFNTIRDCLSADETEKLLKDTYKSYKLEIQEALLVAFAQTVKKVFHQEEMIIELEGHGRFLPDTDVSRTIGWFTSMYPIHLICNQNDLFENIKVIKEQLRSVPNQGFGYGLLKYLLGRLSNNENQRVQLRFNYLGQFSGKKDNDLFGDFTNLLTGEEICLSNDSSALIEINCMVLNGIFHVWVTYHEQAFKVDNMSDFVQTYLQQLRMLIQQTGLEEKVYFTPSDFENIDINQEDLEQLFN
ncbi:amino acid adenylation domain-containing protein [Bacillus thuringiensis]|uniref:amino acid adenylation domain-containing protein n=1 Tax=Bacillus thuringiensis TaxID=1428 RepID=UPI002FBD4A0D